MKGAVAGRHPSKALIQALAEMQEALRGKDSSSFFAQQHVHSAEDDEDGYEEAAASEVSPAVVNEILDRLKEKRLTPPLMLKKLLDGTYEHPLPIQATDMAGDGLDRAFGWVEVHLALFPDMAETQGFFPSYSEGCAGGPACPLCKAYADGNTKWPRLHTNRASGSDGTKAELLEFTRPPQLAGVSPELFAYRRQFSEALAKLLNFFWDDLPAGNDFRHSVLTLLKKKPSPGKAFDPDDADSYRNIACGNTLANLFQVILATRLQHWLVGQKVLSPEQAAFVPQLSCEHLVLVLTETIKMRTDEGLFVAMLFLDISKAYDDVHLALLFEILRKAGAGNKFCGLMSKWFRTRTVSVKGHAKRGECDKGLPQGSAIAPALWNVLFDTLLKRLSAVEGVTITRRKKEGGQDDFRSFIMRFLAYADDLVVGVEGKSISEVRAKLQKVLDIIADWAAEVGLRINTKPGKTEAMIFPPRLEWEGKAAQLTDDVEPLSLVGLDGQELFVRCVDRYKYLGFPLLWNLDLAPFRDSILTKLKRAINRHFIYDPVTKSLSWSSQQQIYSSLVLGQSNYLAAVLETNSTFIKDVEDLFRTATKVMYGIRGSMCNMLKDLEATACPAEVLFGSHQLRFFYSVPHLYRRDYPIVQLLRVQEFEDRQSYYRPRVMKLEQQLTAKRGAGTDAVPTGILRDVSSIKAVKRSVKALRVTAGRVALFEDVGTGAVAFSGRLRERHSIKAAERCRALRGITDAGRQAPGFVNPLQTYTQQQFVMDLYCVGIGTTSEHCLMANGSFRLSMPGPGVPTMTSADKRMGHHRGALHFLLRLNRPAFHSSAFMPPKRAGWKEVAGLNVKMQKAACPVCDKLPSSVGARVQDRESSPMHLMLSCKHERLRRLQVQLRKEAADVFMKAVSAMVRDMRGTLKTDVEKAALDKCKADVDRLCKSGALDQDGVDANNVIYRMMALVPFPEQLAAVGKDSTDSFPLIRAFGRLFDSVEADRAVMGAAATRLISWTEGQIQKFAAARLDILGLDYFQERVGAAGPVNEDTESDEGSVNEPEEAVDGGDTAGGQ